MTRRTALTLVLALALAAPAAPAARAATVTVTKGYVFPGGLVGVYCYDDAGHRAPVTNVVTGAVSGYSLTRSATTLPSGDTARTYSVWLNSAAFTGAAHTQSPLSVGVYGGPVNGCVDVGITSGGTVHLETGNTQLDSAAPLTAGAWHLLVVRYTPSGRVLSLSVDGAAPVTVACNDPWSSPSNPPFALGVPVPSLAPYRSPYLGQLKAAGAWSRALSDAEVTSLYNGGTALAYGSLPGGLTTGLVSYWPVAAQADGSDAAGPNALANNLGTVPTLAVNGGTAVALTSAVWNDQGADADKVYNHVQWVPASALSGSDTVVLSGTRGSLTTAAGPVEAFSLTLTNRAGGTTLPALGTGPRTLRVGWNLTNCSPYEPVCLYSNLVKGMLNTFSGTATVNQTSDANGFPAGSEGLVSAGLTDPYNPFDARRTPRDLFGTYTLTWDGAGNVTLVSADPDHVSVTEDVAQRVLTGTTGNRRVYAAANLAGSTLFSPPIAAGFNTAAGGVSAVTVRPPDVPSGSTGKFRPRVLGWLNSAAVLRTMPMMSINSSNVVDFSDFAQTTWLTYQGVAANDGMRTVTRVEAYTGGAYGRPNTNANGLANFLKVTTSAAHGYKAGQSVELLGPGGTLTLTFSGGGSGNYSGVQATVFPLDSTSFVWAYVLPSPVATLTGAGMACHRQSLDRGMPPEDCIDLVNATPAADLWMNVPHGATDGCVTALFNLAATRMSPGRKIYVELSNEHWNYAAGYNQNGYFATMGFVQNPTAPLSGSEWYALRSAQVHKLALAALTAAGRGSDLRRVFGGNAYVPSLSDAVLAYCAGHDDQGRATGAPGYTGPIPVDCVAIAPYFGNVRMDGNTAGVNALKGEQVLDASEATFQDGFAAGAAGTVTANRAVLTARGYTGAAVVCYEGGPSYGGLGGTAPTKYYRSFTWGYHPRMRGLQLRYFQALQDAGCTLLCLLNLDGAPTQEPGSNDASVYSAFPAISWVAGKGDGTDGKFDNRAALADGSGLPKLPALDQMVSVTGQAVDEWNAGSASAPPNRRPAPQPDRGRQPGRGRGAARSLPPPVRWFLRPAA
jgi:hypothetical protein